ncbi:MAG TPA: hypothetical protein VFA66_02235 [Gaiellaceae bacterium]|nr:hypothetical protein [Gaiellaceae bacterium]
MSAVLTGHAHIKVTGGGLDFEPCEDPGCTVDPGGLASCGRLACPECGCGGDNLELAGDGYACSFGHAWRAA